MEKEKNYIKIENQDFHNILNEVRDEILHNLPLYKIVIARIKRFIKRFRWKMIVRKAMRKVTK